MPTYARQHQLNTSLIYHVYNRSNARVPIFRSREDFYCFMDLLGKYSARFALKIYHWVVMSNHYHLLFKLEQPKGVSKIMAGLAKAYSCYHHKTYSVSGFLWQGRFKLQPVQEEKYLIACGRYIERNPVKAGIVKEAYEYPYSSAKFYSLGESDGITVESPAFSGFGADSERRRSAYTEFLRNFDEGEEAIFNDVERPAGNKDFIKRLLRVNGRFVSRKAGRPAKELLLK